MAKSFFERGTRRALETLGLRDEESRTGRDIVVGAAAASPFLGLLGQRTFKSSPFHGAVAPRMSVHELQMHAQPGDVILTRDGKPTPFRSIHEIVTGSPIHHVEPVIGKRDLYYGTTVNVKEHATPEGQLGSVAEQRANATTVGQRIHDKNYRDVVLLRPKNSVNPEALANHAVLESRKPYSFRRAATSILEDWFLPKIPHLTDRSGTCNSHTCSSLTGDALRHATKDYTPIAGKRIESLLPADFLRSGQFDIVGHTIENPELARELGKRAVRRSLLLRGGTGLALAGATYGLSEDPALATGLLGAAVTPAIARGILGGGAEAARKIRPLSTLLNVFHETTPKALDIKRNITRRTLPLALGGGLLSYLGTKAIQRTIPES